VTNGVRTHRSLQKDAPVSRPVQRSGAIISHAILGGLHHQYVRIKFSVHTGARWCSGASAALAAPSGSRASAAFRHSIKKVRSPLSSVTNNEHTMQRTSATRSCFGHVSSTLHRSSLMRPAWPCLPNWPQRPEAIPRPFPDRPDRQVGAVSSTMAARVPEVAATVLLGYWLDIGSGPSGCSG
jgi:hypothetical protein